METVYITTFMGCTLEVNGEYTSTKDNEESKEYFEIDTIQIERLSKYGIVELLEWSNSKPAGSILSIIEELVLEEINDK